jgi:DNA-binding NarL/FixJ family response regulator
MTSLRVLLAEDHAVVREGTRQILEADPGISVVGEAADGEAIVALAASVPCDVVMLDLGLPLLNGIEATRRICVLPSPPRVLVLTAYDDADYVTAAIEAGAGGYLLKSARAHEVVAAIRAVAGGQLVLHPGLARHLIGRRGGSAERRDELTPRELDVLRLASTGGRTRDIADQLAVSPRTVESTFTSVFNKLGVMTRTEAIVYAAARGWIRLERPRRLDDL